MSDLQSVPSTEKKGSREVSAKWINTNTVLQKVLQQLDADDRSKIVLRCDELPLAAGSEKDFEHLFSSLLQMILQKKDDVPTLFLHISCAEENQNPTAKNGQRYYTIQFNTNIKACTNWLQQNKTGLAEITATLQKNKSTLVVNQLKAAGCIFSVSLPGKSV